MLKIISIGAGLVIYHGCGKVLIHFDGEIICLTLISPVSESDGQENKRSYLCTSVIATGLRCLVAKIPSFVRACLASEFRQVLNKAPKKLSSSLASYRLRVRERARAREGAEEQAKIEVFAPRRNAALKRAHALMRVSIWRPDYVFLPFVNSPFCNSTPPPIPTRLRVRAHRPEDVLKINQPKLLRGCFKRRRL